MDRPLFGVSGKSEKTGGFSDGLKTTETSRPGKVKTNYPSVGNREVEVDWNTERERKSERGRDSRRIRERSG